MEDSSAVTARGFRHAALLYRTPGELVEGVGAFAEAGVAAGEPVLIALPGSALRLVRADLAGHGRHVTWSDSAAQASPAQLIDRMRAYASLHPGRAFRYVHEPARPSRPARELGEVIRREVLVGAALGASSANVLCAYDGRRHRRLAAGVAGTHPEIIRGGRRQPSRSYSGEGCVPPEFDHPLGPVPATAAVLTYRDEQAAARRLAAAHACRAGLPGHRADDITLAVAELAANTRAHTAGTGTLAVWATSEELVCQVSDSGHITDPLAGQINPGPAATSHRGLWIVNQVCDLVEIRTSPAGTTIRIHVLL